MICPRCGHDQPDSTECHGCGIVFAKYRSAGPTKRQAPTSGAGADATADPEPSRQEQTVRLFLASVAVSWASISLLLWGTREAGLGVLGLAIVPLAATFVVWTRIGESIPEPAVRKRIVLTGLWSIWGWFALLLPALFLLSLVAWAAMGETGSEAPRVAMIALAGGLLLIVVGLANTWYCSSRVIRQGGPAPSVVATGATVALGLTLSIALPPLVAAYRRHKEAEELNTRPARQAAALAALQSKCDRGVSQGCYELAEGLERGRYTGAWDAPRELALYARACELGGSPKEPQSAGPTGCVKAGVMCQAGHEVPIDLARAYALYDRGCTFGNLEACDHMGKALAAGQGTPRDAARAAPILERACGVPSAPGFSAQMPPACASLGRLYLDGDGVGQDVSHARTLFQLACDSGDGMGCYELGRLHHRGLGVPKDLLKAEALYDRACTLADTSVDKSGCNGVEQECRGELPRICSSVAKAIYDDQDEPRAAALHRRACEAGLAEGCLRAAWRYETGGSPSRLNSPRARIDLPLARALYERGCELDEKECAAVLRLDVAACEQADAEACRRAAHRYETTPQEGTGGGKLYSAAHFYTLACALDPRSPACDDVGRLCRSAAETDHWQDVSEFCRSKEIAARQR
jgi:TPR repeat protein